MNSMKNYLGFASGILLLGSLVMGCNNQGETKKTATSDELSQMNRDCATVLNNKDAWPPYIS